MADLKNKDVETMSLQNSKISLILIDKSEAGEKSRSKVEAVFINKTDVGLNYGTFL